MGLVATHIAAAAPDGTLREPKPNGKANTVAALMGPEEKQMVRLPASALDVIETPSPAINNVTFPDFHRATTEICAAFYCEHGSLSMGGPMVRHYGILMREWVLPPIGASGNKRWPDPTEKAIAVKLGNWDRKDARVGSLTTSNRNAMPTAPLSTSPPDLLLSLFAAGDVQGRHYHPAGRHVRGCKEEHLQISNLRCRRGVACQI